jgi:hypothetical protein
MEPQRTGDEFRARFRKAIEDEYLIGRPPG